MSREERIKQLSQRPSDSESERIERTERLIKNAIQKSEDYNLRNARVFTKGSVRTRTNIRQTSDIDVCILAENVFFADYPPDTNQKTFKNVSSDYTFTDFRRSVELALISAFGTLVDTSGNKAIRINANISQTRVDADVVPAFEHRRYAKNGNFHEGIELRPKNNAFERIINWPHHNTANSKEKQRLTLKRYRKMVRALKRVKALMKEHGYDTSSGAQSFLIESLLWNVPDELYGNETYEADFDGALTFLTAMLASEEAVSEWGELNELKYLFRPQQPWRREEAHNFIKSAHQFSKAQL